MPRLTKTYIQNTKPTDKRLFVWDTDVTGFGVKVMPTGVISFVFQYRTPEGKTPRVTIGKMDDALTVEQARQIAKDLSRDVLNGKDPRSG